MCLVKFSQIDKKIKQRQIQINTSTKTYSHQLLSITPTHNNYLTMPTTTLSQQQITTLLNQNKSLSQQLTKTKQQHKKLSQKYQKALQQLALIVRANQTLKNQYDNLQAHMNTLIDQKTQSNKAKMKQYLRNDLDELNTKIDRLTEDKDKLEMENTSLKMKLNSTTQEKTKLIKDKDQLQFKYHALSNQLQELDPQTRDNNTRALAVKELKDKAKLVDELQLMVQKLQDQKQSIHHQYQQQLTQIQLLWKQWKQFQKQLSLNGQDHIKLSAVSQKSDINKKETEIKSQFQAHNQEGQKLHKKRKRRASVIFEEGMNAIKGKNNRNNMSLSINNLNNEKEQLTILAQQVQILKNQLQSIKSQNSRLKSIADSGQLNERQIYELKKINQKLTEEKLIAQQKLSQVRIKHVIQQANQQNKRQSLNEQTYRHQSSRLSQGSQVNAGNANGNANGKSAQDDVISILKELHQQLSPLRHQLITLKKQHMQQSQTSSSERATFQVKLIRLQKQLSFHKQHNDLLKKQLSQLKSEKLLINDLQKRLQQLQEQKSQLQGKVIVMQTLNVADRTRVDGQTYAVLKQFEKRMELLVQGDSLFMKELQGSNHLQHLVAMKAYILELDERLRKMGVENQKLHKKYQYSKEKINQLNIDVKELSSGETGRLLMYKQKLQAYDKLVNKLTIQLEKNISKNALNTMNNLGNFPHNMPNSHYTSRFTSQAHNPPSRISPSHQYNQVINLYEEKMINMGEEIVRIRAQKDSLQGEVKELRFKFSQKIKELNERINELNDKERELVRVKTDNINYTNERKLLEKEITQLRALRSTYIRKSASGQFQKAYQSDKQYKGQKAQSSHQQYKGYQEYKGQSKQVANKQSDWTKVKYQRQIQLLKSTIQQLQTQINYLSQHRQRSPISKKHIKEQYNYQVIDRNNTNNNRNQSQNNKSQSQKQLNQLKQAHQQLRQAHQQLKQVHEQLRQAHQQLKQVHEQLRQSNQQLKQVHEQLRQSNQQLKQGNEQSQRMRKMRQQFQEQQIASVELAIAKHQEIVSHLNHQHQQQLNTQQIIINQKQLLIQSLSNQLRSLHYQLHLLTNQQQPQPSTYQNHEQSQHKYQQFKQQQQQQQNQQLNQQQQQQRHQPNQQQQHWLNPRQVQSLQVKLSISTQHINRLQLQMQSLSQLLKSKDKQLRQLQQVILKSNYQLSQLRNQKKFAQYSQIYSQNLLTQQSHQLMQQNSNLNHIIFQLNVKISGLQSIKYNLKLQNQILKGDSEFIQDRLNSIENDIKMKNSTIFHLQNDLRNYQKTYNGTVMAKDSLIRSYENEIHNLKHALDDLKGIMKLEKQQLSNRMKELQVKLKISGEKLQISNSQQKQANTNHQLNNSMIVANNNMSLGNTGLVNNSQINKQSSDNSHINNKQSSESTQLTHQNNELMNTLQLKIDNLQSQLKYTQQQLINSSQQLIKAQQLHHSNALNNTNSASNSNNNSPSNNNNNSPSNNNTNSLSNNNTNSLSNNNTNSLSNNNTNNMSKTNNFNSSNSGISNTNNQPSGISANPHGFGNQQSNSNISVYWEEQVDRLNGQVLSLRSTIITLKDQIQFKQQKISDLKHSIYKLNLKLASFQPNHQQQPSSSNYTPLQDQHNEKDYNQSNYTPLKHQHNEKDQNQQPQNISNDKKQQHPTDTIKQLTNNKQSSKNLSQEQTDKKRSSKNLSQEQTDKKRSSKNLPQESQYQPGNDNSPKKSPIHIISNSQPVSNQLINELQSQLNQLQLYNQQLLINQTHSNQTISLLQAEIHHLNNQNHKLSEQITSLNHQVNHYKLAESSINQEIIDELEKLRNRENIFQNQKCKLLADDIQKMQSAIYQIKNQYQIQLNSLKNQINTRQNQLHSKDLKIGQLMRTLLQTRISLNPHPQTNNHNNDNPKEQNTNSYSREQITSSRSKEQNNSSSLQKSYPDINYLMQQIQRQTQLISAKQQQLSQSNTLLSKLQSQKSRANQNLALIVLLIVQIQSLRNQLQQSQTLTKKQHSQTIQNNKMSRNPSKELNYIDQQRQKADFSLIKILQCSHEHLVNYEKMIMDKRNNNNNNSQSRNSINQGLAKSQSSLADPLTLTVIRSSNKIIEESQAHSSQSRIIESPSKRVSIEQQTPLALMQKIHQPSTLVKQMQQPSNHSRHISQMKSQQMLSLPSQSSNNSTNQIDNRYGTTNPFRQYYRNAQSTYNPIQFSPPSKKQSQPSGTSKRVKINPNPITLGSFGKISQSHNVQSSYGSIQNESSSSYVPYEDDKGYAYTLKNVNMVQSVGDGSNNYSNSSSGSKYGSASKIGMSSGSNMTSYGTTLNSNPISYNMYKDSDKRVDYSFGKPKQFSSNLSITGGQVQSRYIIERTNPTSFSPSDSLDIIQRRNPTSFSPSDSLVSKGFNSSNTTSIIKPLGNMMTSVETGSSNRTSNYPYSNNYNQSSSVSFSGSNSNNNSNSSSKISSNTYLPTYNNNSESSTFNQYNLTSRGNTYLPSSNLYSTNYPSTLADTTATYQYYMSKPL